MSNFLSVFPGAMMRGGCKALLTSIKPTDTVKTAKAVIALTKKVNMERGLGTIHDFCMIFIIQGSLIYNMCRCNALLNSDENSRRTGMGCRFRTPLQFVQPEVSD